MPCPHPSKTARVAGVPISHADRVLFPAIGAAKLELARYYESIARWMLPDLVDRPPTLVHWPKGMPASGARKGIDCVFLKHAKVWGPSATAFASVKKTKTGEYLIADSVAALVGLAQMDVVARPRSLRQDDGGKGLHVVVPLTPRAD